MALSVLTCRKGWNGDIRRNRCILNISSATTDALTPNMVGLGQIFSIVPTGRIGTVDGQTVVGATSVTWDSTGNIIIFYDLASATAALADGNVEVDIYGI